jgi:hypothetical protein
MKLVDLLKAAHTGSFSSREGDEHFHEVIRILDNEGCGLFDSPVRTIITIKDGEIGRCTQVALSGLSYSGQILLESRASEA